MRLYASGQPGGARSDRLLYQAKLALDDNLRLKVVRKMYEVFPTPVGMNRLIRSPLLVFGECSPHPWG